MSVILDDTEATRYVLNFLDQRSATREEIGLLLEQIEDLKFNYYLYDMLSRSEIIATLKDGELAFLPSATPEEQKAYDRNAQEISDMVARGECHPCAS